MALTRRGLISWRARCRASLVMIAALLVLAHATPASAASNSALAWGEDRYGQLGDGAKANSDLPVLVEGLTGVVAVSASGSHSMALLSSGKVMGWGGNIYGQLGDRTHENSDVPVEVKGLKQAVTAISAGANHSLARLENGSVMAWGENMYGQLGDGTSGTGSASDVAVEVSGLSGVKAVSGGGDHSLALLENGTVMAWGKNTEGQLGDANTTDSDVPVAVRGLSGVTAIAAGQEFSVALLENGTVMAWGLNKRGQLGDGTTTNSDIPTPVTGLGGVKAISAGLGHTVALLDSATVMAWGYNVHGQLGDGSTIESDVPVAVQGLSGVKAISCAGGETSLALLDGETVMAWGYNDKGQLGDGTTKDSDVPVMVQGLKEVAGIAAGGNHSLAFGPAGASAPAPVVSSLVPDSGPVSGGKKVKIEGENFTGATAVKFGANAASFTVDSDRSITTTLPPGEAGSVNVTVTTPAGTSTITRKDRFQYKKGK